MHSRFVAATLCLALASPVASLRGLAYADEPPPEAKRAFGEGKAAYDQGDYDTALRDFQRAQLIAPAPSLYYNIGMAFDRLGRFGEAAASFDKYLAQVGAPRNDDERAAQAKVKERAAADRARAQVAQPAYTPPPPAPYPEPQQPPPGYAPYYYYAPYGQPMMSPGMQMLTRDERIRRAKSQRTTGIVLLSVGGALIITSIVLFDVASNQGSGDGNGGLSGPWVGEVAGGVIALLGGIAIAIPGAVVLARGVKALNVEKRTPDDSAATRRAALDLAAPPVRLAQPQLAFALPPIRF